MSFRTRDKLRRYEMARFSLDSLIEQPANDAYQKKSGYIFNITNRSNIYDYFNGYFEVVKELQKKADGSGYAAADRISIINGSHSLIKHMKISSAAKILYDTNNIHKTVNVKNLLEYSNDFSKTISTTSFWFLDTEDSTANTNLGFEARRVLTQARQNDGNGGAKSVHDKIQLNRYSFFEALEDEMLPPMQLTIELQLNDDAELIHKANAADDGRVVVTRFYLWLPKMIPKNSEYGDFVKDFLKPTKWMYMKDFYLQSAETRSDQNTFIISPSINNVQHVFIYLQRSKGPNNNESERSPYIFDTFKLNSANNNSSLKTCRLEYDNSTFYPELEYDASSKIRIFTDLMSYAYRNNDVNTGTQLNFYNFASIYGLIHFDLTYQDETVTNDPKQLILTYNLNTAPAANIRAHAIVFYENEVIVNKVGNELTIV